MISERALTEFYTTTDIKDILSKSTIREVEIVKNPGGYSFLFSYKSSNEDFQYIAEASVQDEQLKNIRRENEQLPHRLRKNLGKLETALEYEQETGKARRLYLWMKKKLM